MPSNQENVKILKKSLTSMIKYINTQITNMRRKYKLYLAIFNKCLEKSLPIKP